MNQFYLKEITQIDGNTSNPPNSETIMKSSAATVAFNAIAVDKNPTFNNALAQKTINDIACDLADTLTH
eukprot:5197799-Amphidinium_carterae.2